MLFSRKNEQLRLCNQVQGQIIQNNHKQKTYESIGKINITPQDIGLVILNLITNAFYAVGKKRNNNQKACLPDRQVMNRLSPSVQKK